MESCEPMDIDLSSHSVTDMDISYGPSEDFKQEKQFIKTEKHDVSPKEIKLSSRDQRSKKPYDQSAIKKYHIKVKKHTKTSKILLFQILSAVIIVIVSIFTFRICSLKCCDDFNLEVLSDTLSNKIFGQSDAINVLIKTLELKERSKLIFFSGGTGVGKTLAASLLLDTVGSSSNVYHYTMPSFTSTFSTDFMLGLTMCEMSLVIVDDLTTNDMHVKTQIRELIEKTENLNKNITVILIYNCYESSKDLIKRCDISFHKRLMDNFADIKAYKRIVEFKPLSETNLKECIKQELGRRKVDNLEFDVLLKNFNVTIDGCKGVHSKIKYLNIV